MSFFYKCGFLYFCDPWTGERQVTPKIPAVGRRPLNSFPAETIFCRRKREGKCHSRLLVV